MPNAADCCLCSQIEGHADGDLIARLLGMKPYVRRVMAESASFAVLPSLGPLTPGHALLCPRSHVRSMTALPPGGDGEYRRLKAEMWQRLAELYDAPIHVFEHGVAASGERTLCTVDHAHVHLVPVPVGRPR